MSGSLEGLGVAVMEAYREADAQVAAAAAATGLGCPTGCGRCCWNPEVEASVLELVPLALELYRRDQAEPLLEDLERRATIGDPVCALFRPHEADPDRGRCAEYAHRPLLCRLFGWTARRDKHGRPELSVCRVIRDGSPDAVRRAGVALANGLPFPVIRDQALRLRSLDPNLGGRVLPINRALTEALTHMLWKRPLDLRSDRAS